MYLPYLAYHPGRWNLGRRMFAEIDVSLLASEETIGMYQKNQKKMDAVASIRIYIAPCKLQTAQLSACAVISTVTSL